ncbi:hypothetical protein SUGI_0550080 [Cryptomeria japonica]|nr:hypothetical protein SUGI_0550080 [Cryptomeria japonica]
MGDHFLKKKYLEGGPNQLLISGVCRALCSSQQERTHISRGCRAHQSKVLVVASNRWRPRKDPRKALQRSDLWKTEYEHEKQSMQTYG